MENQELKEKLLVSCFRILNVQGQEYILNTIEMVKDKYTKDTICFPTWKMTEEEYVEQLRFCTKNNLLCFEYHRRHKDWKVKKQQEQDIAKKHYGGIKNAKKD